MEFKVKKVLGISMKSYLQVAVSMGFYMCMRS